MPTQQRPYRALTELLADQFHLIRFLTFQKLVLASLFLFARYFLRFAREVVPLDWHCLMMVAFDALVHQLDQLLCSVLVYLFLQITNFGVYCRWQISYFLGFRRWYLPQFSIVRQTISDIQFGASSSRFSLRLTWFPILRQLSYFIYFDHLLAMI
ncbi:Hypothetical_protein [Hexamita inflata]|uniref:Hypothetical_protein n=1 Tax=Hexamita inflata TaxID=28002 RepID=A0AA86PP62_9EUKA|nr:Hypothetical protein HINF_LOCUS29801 [Hexamita inflata]